MMYLKLTLIIITLFIGYLNADEYLEDENATEIYYKGLKVSDQEICERNVCLTKCCPYGAKYDAKIRECVNATEVFDPPLYDNYLRPQSANASNLFYFKIGILKCGNLFRFQLSSFTAKTKEKSYFRTDGKLYIVTPLSIPPWFVVNPERYCIDNFVKGSEGNRITEVDALFCYSADEEEPHNYLLTATCMLVSCVFILMTVGVYLWLPKLHNVHGRVLTAYLVCLFTGFLFMATMQLTLYYEKATNKGCEIMTFIIYFSLLSAFFWLNVMCYDIWRVFSGKREMRPQKLLIRSQIRAYALYAFGIPTILTILLISLEYSDLGQHPWLPMIRLQGCFISGNSRLLYLYGPILILCVANMILFVLTAVEIAMTRGKTAMLRSRDNSRHDQENDNKQTLLLYVKLFILMGISWILEVISALYPSKHWVYSDVYNVLIGLVIFIIFVCKRQILHLIKKRYRQVWGSGASQSQSSSRTNTTKDEIALNSSFTQ